MVFLLLRHSLVTDLKITVRGFHVNRNFIENENIFAEFFQFDRIRFHITQNAIAIIFINTEEMRIIFVQNDGRRSKLDLRLNERTSERIYRGELFTKLNLPKSSPSCKVPTTPLP